MASFPAHDRTRKTADDDDDDDDEIDPVEEMIKKTGCLDKHWAVQDCMAEKEDWRQCQQEVSVFKKCMMDHAKQQILASKK